MKKKMLDMRFKVDPYSMQDRAPGEKLGQIFDVVNNLYSSPIIAQQMEAQGARLNLKELHRQVVKLTQLNELDDIIEFPGVPAEEAVAGGEQQSNRPAQTHRVNERISRRGAPEGGVSDDILRAAFAGKSAPPSATPVEGS